jgi:hypothetical protein
MWWHYLAIIDFTQKSLTNPDFEDATNDQFAAFQPANRLLIWKIDTYHW